MLKNMLDNFFYLQYLEACQSKNNNKKKKTVTSVSQSIYLIPQVFQKSVII